MFTSCNANLLEKEFSLTVLLSTGQNLLSGSIPPQLAYLRQLTSLRLSKYKSHDLKETVLPLVVPILSYLNLSPFQSVYYLDDNNLSGTIPTLTSLRQLESMDFQMNNGLVGSLDSLCFASQNLTEACADCATGTVTCYCCENLNCCF